MNSSPQPRDAAVDEQAAYWAMRLEGDVLEARERAELDAWLAQSAEHRTALSGYCQFSADLEEQLPRLVAAGAVKMPPTPPPRARRWTLPRISLLALAATAAIAFGIWTLRPANPVENYAAAVGSTASYTLEDGTRVELNANTSLRFESTAAERHVRLAAGEAIFTVTKDASRPFIVETPAGSVRVTGTVFNVRNDPVNSLFEVTVVEGSVEVRPVDRNPRSAFSLVANDQLCARRGEVAVTPLSAEALDNALAWRRGQIVLKDVPLREAVARFAHYHGRAINVAPEIADQHVGGQYALKDVMGFLKGMESVLPGTTVSVDADGTASLGPKP